MTRKHLLITEAAVAMLVLGIVFALVLPKFKAAQQEARIEKRKAMLSDVANAILMYGADHSVTYFPNRIAGYKVRTPTSSQYPAGALDPPIYSTTLYLTVETNETPMSGLYIYDTADLTQPKRLCVMAADVPYNEKPAFPKILPDGYPTHSMYSDGQWGAEICAMETKKYEFDLSNGLKSDGYILVWEQRSIAPATGTASLP